MHKTFVSRFFLIIFIVILIALGIFIFQKYFKNTTQDTFIVDVKNTFTTATSTTVKKNLSEYIEVVDGCNPYFVGDCVNMRSGPGVEYSIVGHLRTGVVLKVGNTVIKNGSTWYEITFSTALLYPERKKSKWYVNADYVTPFTDQGDRNSMKGVHATTTKHIIVDVSEQKLYAYDGDILFMEESISTGLEFTPTPRGTFSVFKMTPSRFMQGPIPGVSDQVYDLPGVPWNLYFTSGGAVIHGAYWHDHFGKPWSHGCVNLPPQKAKELYEWAEIDMPVVVRN